MPIKDTVRTRLADYASSLRALANRMAPGPEAEDCIQSTFVLALSQPEPPRKLRAWLRRVLRNEIYAQFRRSSRRRRRELLSQAPRSLPAPDDRAGAEQIVVAIRTVLATLDEPYRTTIRRRFLLGHAAVRIAADESCSAGTIRWRAHEGLRRMRRALDNYYDDRGQWLEGLAAVSGAAFEIDDVVGEPVGSASQHHDGGGGASGDGRRDNADSPN